MAPPELVEIARLWTILAYVDARLAFLPMRWNRRWLFRDDDAQVGMPGPRTMEKIETITIRLRSVSRFRLRSATPCLCLSLALRARLAAMGLRPKLALGVRRREPPVVGATGERRGSFALGIDAHAWIVLGDATIDPTGSRLPFEELGHGDRTSSARRRRSAAAPRSLSGPGVARR